MVLSLLTFANLQTSIRKSRDAQRRADINSIFDALSKYQNEFGFFPPSSEYGKIIACRSGETTPPSENLTEAEYQQYFISTLKECEWGRDSLRDVEDLSYQPYLTSIPPDPYHNRGIDYYYLSNMHRFQLFAYLEGGSREDGFREEVVLRNIKCGNKTCNFGRAFADENIGKNLEEIETELRDKNR